MVSCCCAICSCCRAFASCSRASCSVKTLTIHAVSVSEHFDAPTGSACLASSATLTAADAAFPVPRTMNRAPRPSGAVMLTNDSNAINQ